MKPSQPASAGGFGPTLLIERPASRRYGLAIATVLLAWLFRRALTPMVGVEALPFIFFFPAVAATAWYGGLGPALASTALATGAAVWSFRNPAQPLGATASYLTGAGAFVVACLFIAAAIQAMHRARSLLVTEFARRTQLRSELSDEHDLLQTTLASIGDGVIATDSLGWITFLNHEAERLTGWRNEQAMGRPLLEVFRILNEHTRQPSENPVEKALRSGAVVGLSNHTVLVSKSGVEIPIDDSAAPIRHADGSIFGVVLVFRDFTEQRRSDEARARLAAIVQHSGDAIFTKDLNGFIQTWNASAERLFGYNAEEIVGKHITTLFPPDRLKEEDHILGLLRAGQTVERFETVRVAKNGRQIPVSVTISPLKDSDGRIIGASKVVHDITEKKAAESAMNEVNRLLATRAEELEKMVQERTASLRTMVGELQHVSYAITHDMRAPLRAMSSFASFIMEDLQGMGEAAAKSIEHCRRIITAATRLDRLIQDSLNYTRAILQEAPLQPVDLSRLVPALIEGYPNLQPDRADIKIENHLPVVLGEESLLTQCFSNLLGNAVKFVPPGTRPKVSIASHSFDSIARITIQDNGIGISAAAQPRLFRMFQRITADYDGTGVGLAIVRKVVERMGGKVGVESEPGKGSRFWVELRKKA
ncbi:MAG: hypothetical protein C5B50_18125 [Verrucomicrobia bacterium]|nr:MAG: hypothetical protein C5B50_18125 [Verrucomicrobiota bacterium]